MDFDQALSNLMLHYGLRTQTELANKLGTTQSTISGWRARNSIGALVTKVADVDQGALPHIFPAQTNHFGNVVGTGVNNGSGSTTVNNNGSKIDLSGLDESMLVLFRDVYQKLEKTGELKKLHDLLGQLKWE